MKSPMRALGWPAVLASLFLVFNGAAHGANPPGGAGEAESEGIAVPAARRLGDTGAADPMKNRSQYTIFSRREIAAYFPSANNEQTRQWRQASGNLSTWQVIKSDTQQCGSSIQKLVAAAGRITDCETEQIVRAHYRVDNHTIHLQMDTAGNPSREQH